MLHSLSLKYQELRSSKSWAFYIVDDKFGCQHGNTLSEGLVDSSNEEEFSENLGSYRTK